MNHKMFVIVLSLFSINCLSLAEPSTTQTIATDTALTYATVIEYEFNNGQKSDKGELIAKYGFDKRNNLVEIYDKKGLFLKYSFDSLNNVYAEYFYENYDLITRLRVPSSKWFHEYANGVIKKTFRYYFEKSKWYLKETIRIEYSFNSNNQIIEDSIFDNSNNLKEITKSEYLQGAPFEKYPFDFNRIGTLTKHFCTKEVTYSANGEVKDSARYFYDEYKRKIKKLEYIPNQKIITVISYKYDENNRLIEQSQYFGDDGSLFYTNTFEYDYNGLKIRETSFDSKNVPNWTREFKY